MSDAPERIYTASQIEVGKELFSRKRLYETDVEWAPTSSIPPPFDYEAAALREKSSLKRRTHSSGRDWRGRQMSDFVMEIIDPDTLTGGELDGFRKALTFTPFHEIPEDFLQHARKTSLNRDPACHVWRISAKDFSQGIIVTAFEYSMDGEPLLSVDILSGKGLIKHSTEIMDSLMKFAGHFGIKKLVANVRPILARQMERDGHFRPYCVGIIREF